MPALRIIHPKPQKRGERKDAQRGERKLRGEREDFKGLNGVGRRIVEDLTEE